MGTTATSIFADDTACDVREEFIARLADGDSPAEATEAMTRRWASQIADADDGPVFWLALAATQWKYGCLDQHVKSRALEVIESGSDLRRWAGRDAERRAAVLLKLRETLLGPQPPTRRPRRPKREVLASMRAAAPDGGAVAIASDMGQWPEAGTLWTQVMIDFGAAGSGVCAIGCAYHEISLTWTDCRVLEIAYPASAILRKGAGQEDADRIFNRGVIVGIVYRPRAA